MPEGDIVARVARTFDAILTGRTLEDAQLRWPTLGAADLVGRTVTGNRSVGKHLLTRFDDGRTLHTHLRMDGTWRVHDARTVGRPDPRGDAPGRRPRPFRPDRHPDVRCLLRTRDHLVLGRLLGMMDLVATQDEHLLVGHLGPDVLDPALDVAAAGERILAQGPRGIGEVLLDQRVVAGLGTIYLAESLWRVRVHPRTAAGSLGPLAADVVATAAALMGRSVAARTPTATGYADPGFARGVSAAAPQEGEVRATYVHGREGQACARCGHAIARIDVGPPTRERPAFFCPRCQPGP